MVSIMKNKKFIASAVAAAAVATAVSPASAAEMKFTDVPDRYTEAVQFLFDLGIVAGESETKFGTQNSVKRQDAAVMIAKALGYTKDGDYAKSAFTDVPADIKWAVDALAEKGIVHGKTATSFGAKDPLTRNETAKILAIAAGFEIDQDLKETQFTDVNERFAKYVDALVKNKITVGKTATQFAANQPVTRGEAALFLHRSAEQLMGEKTFPLSIMHVNDTHARAAESTKMVTAVKDFRAENPNSLLLHAGDVFSGTLYFNEFQGKADLEIMKLMNFDAMTFGNHEFDLGSSEEGHKALQEFIKAANFPFVSANVDFSKDPLFEGLFQTKITEDAKDANIYTGIVKEVNGEKVGIFGLTTKETEDIASPELVSFNEDYLEDAQKMVDEFEKMGVNKVVALTHIGYDDNPAIDNDLLLAKGVEGIDVIVGGHTHTALAKPVIIEENEEPTVIVQTGANAENLGTLDVVFDKEGAVLSFGGKLLPLKDLAADAQATAVLAPFKTEVDKISNQETSATATAALENPRTSDNPSAPSVRKNETALGNIITDGMLAKAKESNENVVMAIQNGGGIRAAIDAGPITVGEIITVLPFTNTLATMQLTGAELKEAFEISVGKYPLENGGFLHVSGAKVEFDSSKPAGERVVSIAIEGENGALNPVEDATTYTIATNAFTAKGGDDYDVFAKAYAEGRVTDLGLSDWENFKEELERIGEVTPAIEGRIVDVNAEN
ncbi:5'-nucleotidase C-terminal domain-containing protein [Planococcus sp. N064]|uniref:5'-nucleotidase C-terminal domain-containing protein n=1 Tax=Planococcus liqunii TaxID=3058394 RepID=A0ABT8MNK4_9BACL|nr:5'-nucleotidase C-terminal domain-containing protein [Planococcus sp. N064]MDN7226482.1 5'-nucleotidase C-terminal domain-containing protein [Planococcus sp. N064]